MKLKDIKPENIKIIDVKNSTWNCDKCILFKPDICECNAVKRLLFSQILGDDCDDCKRPFVLKDIN